MLISNNISRKNNSWFIYCSTEKNNRKSLTSSPFLSSYYWVLTYCLGNKFGQFNFGLELIASFIVMHFVFYKMLYYNYL